MSLDKPCGVDKKRVLPIVAHLVLQDDGGHVRGGEGVSEELPTSILDLLAHSTLDCQLAEGGISHRGEGEDVDDLYLSLTLFCEYL